MPISLQPPRASESLDHLSRIDLVRRRQRRLLRRSSVPSGRWRRWRWGSPARVPGRGTTTPSSAGDLRRSAATRGRHRLLPPPHYKVWDLPGELSKFCNSWHEMITLVMVYKGQRILELKEQLKLCSIWDMLFFWMAITIFLALRTQVSYIKIFSFVFAVKNPLGWKLLGSTKNKLPRRDGVPGESPPPQKKKKMIDQGCNSIDTKNLRLGLRMRLRTRLGRRFPAKMVKAWVKAVQMSIESPPRRCRPRHRPPPRPGGKVRPRRLPHPRRHRRRRRKR